LWITKRGSDEPFTYFFTSFNIIIVSITFGKKEFSEEYYKNLFSLMEAGLETASTVQDALNFTKLAKIINDNDLFVGSDRWFDYLKKLQKKVWSSDSFTTLASTDSEVEDLELLEAYGTSLFIFNRV